MDTKAELKSGDLREKVSGNLKTELYNRLFQYVIKQKKRMPMYYQLDIRGGKIRRLMLYCTVKMKYYSIKIFVKDDRLMFQCNQWGKNVIDADVFFPGINDVSFKVKYHWDLIHGK